MFYQCFTNELLFVNMGQVFMTHIIGKNYSSYAGCPPKKKLPIFKLI